MRFLPFISLFACLATPIALADGEAFQFSYVPNEGMAASKCRHAQIEELPDYRVKCTTEFGQDKVFTAHVVLREYKRAAPLGTGLEILYWVTEPGTRPGQGPQFHATTALLNFRGESSLADLYLAQAVENDYASLVLEVNAELADRAFRSTKK